MAKSLLHYLQHSGNERGASSTSMPKVPSFLRCPLTSELAQCIASPVDRARAAQRKKTLSQHPSNCLAPKLQYVPPCVARAFAMRPMVRELRGRSKNLLEGAVNQEQKTAERETGYSADVQRRSGRTSGAKKYLPTARNAEVFVGADIHDLKARTSMTRGPGEGVSEKLYVKKSSGRLFVPQRSEL